MKNRYLEYPAQIEYTNEGTVAYLVEFPDLPQCITEGNSIEEAKSMAKEALSLCLDVLVKNDKDFPKPSKLEGENIYYITAELGKSTSYSEYHKKSYEKNKQKVLSKKREKELELKSKGYKDFREMLPAQTLVKLDKLTKSQHITRREFITKLIEKEYTNLTV